MKNPLNKFQTATVVAAFFHLVGLMGILFFDRDLFIRATPLNLLLSLALLIWTQPEKNTAFAGFILFSFFFGFAVEAIGVNTGLLFGDYSYGTVLGPGILGVPLIIGVNWIMIIYCCGVTTHTMLGKVSRKLAAEMKEPPVVLKAISVIVDGATLAVLFDWLMEPVAVKLGFWTWHENEGIPAYNYFCWLVISAMLLAVFHFLSFSKENKFAVNLLLIQAMFFLLLRTFLN